jgi:SAM-dependent methyltransferase
LAGADHITWLHHGGRPARWGNFGLWNPGRPRDYAGACRALAHAVGEAAGMRAGDSVLSLACGAGEELPLWAEAFGAVSVMGLEQTPGLAAQARQRAEAAHASCEIEVHCADARRIAQLIGGRFDRIVCVDALYHLGPRAPLLRAARTRLFPGGAFAFTDLVLDRRGGAAWRQAALRLGAGLTGIDAAEVRSPEECLTLLREAGFDDAQVTRLDDAVLDGFCAFAERQARRIGLAARWSAGWRRVAITAALIRAGRGAGLGYALYSGRVNAAPEDDADPPDAWAATAPEETLAP